MPATLCASLGAVLTLFACHKTVWAAPIVAISADTGVAMIQLPSGDRHSVVVPARFFADPDKPPHPGDYLVVYAEGYMSWSPKGVFEDGYSKAGGEPLPPHLPVGVDRMTQFFGYQHLPPHLQVHSKPFHDLAQTIVNTLPANPERTVALRKLLEAKDCAVRAWISKEPEPIRVPA